MAEIKHQAPDDRPQASPLEVSRFAPTDSVTSIFDRALRIAFPGASDAAIAAEFQGKVTRFAVRHWRQGRTSMPLWARDIVLDRFDKWATTMDALRRERAPPGRWGWQYRQKEKAGG